MKKQNQKVIDYFFEEFFNDYYIVDTEFKITLTLCELKIERVKNMREILTQSIEKIKVDKTITDKDELIEIANERICELILKEKELNKMKNKIIKDFKESKNA